MTEDFKGAPIDSHQPDRPQTEPSHALPQRAGTWPSRLRAREACLPRPHLSHGRYPDIIRLPSRPPSRTINSGRRSSRRRPVLEICVDVLAAGKCEECSQSSWAFNRKKYRTIFVYHSAASLFWQEKCSKKHDARLVNSVSPGFKHRRTLTQGVELIFIHQNHNMKRDTRKPAL